MVSKDFLLGYGAGKASGGGGGGGGGGDGAENDVTFYDYDGTVVQSYTAAEFAELTELPENPSRKGLTAQGWNWALEEAQSHVAKYGKLNVGQMYITDDGKTRIHIKLVEGRLAPYLCLGLNGTCVVDWGDGSPTDTMTGTAIGTVKSQQHTYAAPGEYVIAVKVDSGEAQISGDSSASRLLSLSSSGNKDSWGYPAAIISVYLGRSMTVGNYAFFHCAGLREIAICKGSFEDAAYMFDDCSNLAFCTVDVLKDRVDQFIFYGCRKLNAVSLPQGVSSVNEYAFGACSAMRKVTLPESVNIIYDNAFRVCYSLEYADIPDQVTAIGKNAFEASAISSVSLPSSLQTVGQAAFSSSWLKSVRIPAGVIFSQNTYSSCYSLQSVSIDSGVTELPSAIFNLNRSLASVVIPSSVQRIGSYAFNNCFSLGFIRFESTVPPAVSSSNAFFVSNDCIIYVPAGTLEAYTTATNYPNPSKYTYVEY